jgi:uncharacterized protein (TIGR02145 family)
MQIFWDGTFKDSNTTDWNYNKSSNFSFKLRPIRTFSISKNPSKPVFDSITVNAITNNSFYTKVFIKNDGGNYITSKGICWSKNPNPTTNDNKTEIGTGEGDYFADISNLETKVNYYVRAFTINKYGTMYSDEKTIYTYAGENVFQNGSGLVDIDGNTYPSVIIGSQEWMASSLRTSKFSNGELIKHVKTSTDWWNAGGELNAYCYPNEDSLKYIDECKLYSYMTALDSRKICPTGWHLPTDNDWNLLIQTLGGSNQAGGKLKSINKNFWKIPNTGATNTSGLNFNGYGIRDINVGPDYKGINSLSCFWSNSSTTDGVPGLSGQNSLESFLVSTYTSKVIKSLNSKGNALQIRCIKD